MRAVRPGRGIGNGGAQPYYLQARYYDPTTAQFLSLDPAVDSTLSPYAYVAGNPLNATDPSGLDPWGNDVGNCDASSSGSAQPGIPDRTYGGPSGTPTASVQVGIGGSPQIGFGGAAYGESSALDVSNNGPGTYSSAPNCDGGSYSVTDSGKTLVCTYTTHDISTSAVELRDGSVTAFGVCRTLASANASPAAAVVLTNCIAFSIAGIATGSAVQGIVSVTRRAIGDDRG